MATAPVANDDQITFTEQAASFQLQVADLIDNDTGTDLTINSIRGDTGDIVASIQDTYIEIQKPTDYFGTFRLLYTVTDANGLKDEGVVEVTVENVNDVPLTSENGQSFTVQSGTTLTVEGDRGILRAVPNANLDVNGDPVDDDDYTAILDQTTSNGTLSLNSDGGFTYTPNAGFTGEDTFTYFVNDGKTNSVEARTVSITVPTDTTNQAPVASDDSYTGTEDTIKTIKSADVISNDSDPDGGPEPIYIDRVYGAYGGAVSLEDANIFFEPDADFNGIASFVYVVSDGLLEDIGVVEIDFAAVNDAPVANDEPEPFLDRYVGYDDETLVVVPTEGLLFNDTDADGDALEAVLVDQASNGTVTLNADGSFEYTPNASFTGVDSFTYYATDGSLNSLEQTVEIEVLAGEDGGNGRSLPFSQSGTDGADVFTGTENADNYKGFGGNDDITGLASADGLSGGDGNDTIRGDGGEDTLEGGAGADSIEGGAGNDKASGGFGDDVISGGIGLDTIRGGDGGDEIRGNDGNDSILGGAGADSVFGGIGADYLNSGDGNDSVEGGNGNDTINSGWGADEVRGGDGADSILGGDAADTIYGGAGDDYIDGQRANDSIFGGGGNDTLEAFIGTDTLLGEGGDDEINGGLGNDSVDGGLGFDTIFGGDGGDTLLGGGDDDEIYTGIGADSAEGGSGADSLYGGGGNDSLYGQDGNDLLLGGIGADLMEGGAGNDTLRGGNQADTVDGGAGNDDLYGGGGADLFIFEDGFGEDTIFDFSLDEGEKIDLSGVTEITDFSDLQGSHLSESGGNSIIEDSLGNTITLNGVTNAELEATDFIF